MTDVARRQESPEQLEGWETEYRRLRRKVRRAVCAVSPPGASIAVVSDGDDDLLQFAVREGLHFPQTESGTYAGFLPADDAEAISQLEAVREKGVQFLVLPATTYWWLEHYAGFREHLETEHRRCFADENCVVFDLGSVPARAPVRRKRRKLREASRSDRKTPGNVPPTAGTVDIDVMRSKLHERFFQTYAFDSFDELSELIPTLPDLDSFEELPDADRLGYSGWAYWFFFVKGYLDYLETGTIGKGNSYYEYLQRHIIPARRVDRGLSDELTNPMTAIERVARRFRDLDYYHHPGLNNAVAMYGPAPVKLIVSHPPPEGARRIFVWGSDEPLLVKRIDGQHRMFAARLFGHLEHRAEIVAERHSLGHVLGSVEDFRFDGGRLEIRGWCLHPRHQVQSFEVRHEQSIITQVWVEERADIAERFPEVPHAVRCGFAVDVEHALPTDEPLRFEIRPRSDWLPIGAISVPYYPAVSDLRACKALDGMLGPLARQRPLDSFASVLVCEGEPALRALAKTVLPKAVHVEEHPELMLAHSVLTGLAPDEQAEWLRGASELLPPGGYLVATVLGELVRPFLAGSDLGQGLDEKGVARDGDVTYQTKAHTVQECSRWFEVLEYVEGGVDDREDLIVLRRRP